MRANVARLKAQSARLRVDPVLGCLVVAAIALRFPTLGQQSFWGDETLTAWELRHPLGTAIANLPKLEASPPLYFLLSWGWTHVFGVGEAGLRSLSAVAGVAIVPVVYMAARMLFSRRAGLIAGALAAFSPALVWYSQEARPYALAFLFSAASFLFFARVLLITAAPRSGVSAREREPPATGRWQIEDNLRRNCVLWAVTSALAMTTHYFTWFLVLVEAVWLLVVTRERPGRRGLRKLVHGLARPVLVASLVLVATAGCLVALAIYQRIAGGGSDLGVISHVPLSIRLKSAITAALFGDATRSFHLFFHLDLYLFEHLVELMFVTVVALLLWRGTRRQQRAAGLCLLTAAVAVALPIAADFAGARYIVGRYLLMMLPIVLVGFAIALAQTRPRWVGPALAGLLCAGSLMVLANVVAHRWAQRQDWRDAAKALGPARVDRAIVVGPALVNPSPAPRLIALSGIYLKSVQAMPRAGQPVSEIDLLQVGGAPVYPRVAHPRPPLPGFRLVERKGNGNFELFRYVSPKPVVANPAYLNRERLLVGDELLPEQTSVGIQRASSRRDAER
jgi:uncharacterized membrane protein